MSFFLSHQSHDSHENVDFCHFGANYANYAKHVKNFSAHKHTISISIAKILLKFLRAVNPEGQFPAVKTHKSVLLTKTNDSKSSFIYGQSKPEGQKIREKRRISIKIHRHQGSLTALKSCKSKKMEAPFPAKS